MSWDGSICLLFPLVTPHFDTLGPVHFIVITLMSLCCWLFHSVWRHPCMQELKTRWLKRPIPLVNLIKLAIANIVLVFSYKLRCLQSKLQLKWWWWEVAVAYVSSWIWPRVGCTCVTQQNKHSTRFAVFSRVYHDKQLADSNTAQQTQCLCWK